MWRGHPPASLLTPTSKAHFEQVGSLLNPAATHIPSSGQSRFISPVGTPPSQETNLICTHNVTHRSFIFESTNILHTTMAKTTLLPLTFMTTKRTHRPPPRSRCISGILNFLTEGSSSPCHNTGTHTPPASLHM